MSSLRPLCLCLGLFTGFSNPLFAANDKGLDILISSDAIPSMIRIVIGSRPASAE
ncbi:MAG: hypothetical protein ABIO94_01490 [Opitutaceae bacterium]